MNVSYNWLRSYLDISQTPEQIGEILTEIGLEVEGIEKHESIPGSLEGIVVGEVLSCEKHPNADRLKRTQVDVGGSEALSIVCGAPNVAQGQKVAVATIGTMLYPVDGDALKIKKGKIRGEVSEGMICAEDEVGLGSSHEGIMVLPSDTQVGAPLSDIYPVEVDYIYEVGLTPNRSDGVCHMGVAKDLYAELCFNHGYEGPFRVPEHKEEWNELPSSHFTVNVRNTESCPRYSGVIIEGVGKAQTPDWIVSRLKSIGVKIIDPVVDVTNYILHEYGQPLHAFDLDKIKSKGIIVQNLSDGAPFVSLDGSERKLKSTDLVICDGDDNPMCIAGVYGGLNSGVTGTTRNIFLESAHFESETIRRTSVHHQLRTDAAKVYEKGSDPNVCMLALKKATELICEITGAQVGSQFYDVYPEPVLPVEIELAFDYVTSRIGVHIEPAQITRILELMEMEVNPAGEKAIMVKVPTNKPDVTRPADLVEEILRIYGLNKIPFEGPGMIPFNVREGYSDLELKNKVAGYLTANGFQETLGLSLITEKYLPDGIGEEHLIRIHNTSNQSLDIMRPTLLCTALQVVDYNKNRMQSDLQFFEVGRAYHHDGYIVETEMISINMTGQVRPSSWMDGELESSLFLLKSHVTNLLTTLGIQGVALQESQEEDQLGLVSLLVLKRGNSTLGHIGYLDNGRFPHSDVDQRIWSALIFWDETRKALPKKSKVMQTISPYPVMKRDLSVLVPSGVSFKDMEILAVQTGKKIVKSFALLDIYENDKALGEGNRSFMFRLVFEDVNKTLTVKEVDKVIQKLLHQWNEQLHVKLRK